MFNILNRPLRKYVEDRIESHESILTRHALRLGALESESSFKVKKRKTETVDYVIETGDYVTEAPIGTRSLGSRRSRDNTAFGKYSAAFGEPEVLKEIPMQLVVEAILRELDVDVSYTEESKVEASVELTKRYRQEK